MPNKYEMNDTGTWFTGYTLVGITNTGVIKHDPILQLKRNQQRNWETILQVISLRAQPMAITPSQPMLVPLKEHQFGSAYTNKQLCWKFKFYIEHRDTFGPSNDPDLFLKTDFDQVPIISNLTETVKGNIPIFYTSGEFKNIYFKFSP